MDRNAEALGVSVEELMRNAGTAVAELVLDRFPDSRIRIFCGHGNNGGDGLAAAIVLKDAKITMVDGCTMRSEASSAMAEAVGKRMEPFDGLESDFDVLIDAGLGVGIAGELRPIWKRYTEFCNDFEGVIISVDVPTGFGTGTQVVPDITVTMVDSKVGMDEASCGEIIIADIGMPLEASLCTGPGDMLRYPVPKSDCHKGDSGKLMIVGGGPYYGAPMLAAKAAMRMGTDMVYAAVPENVVGNVVGFAPECIPVPLPGNMLTPDHVPMILERAKGMDAVLIGPGLGNAPCTIDAVKEIASALHIPAVIDADAITAFAGLEGKFPNVVTTPHMGEFKRLGGSSSDSSDVRAVASERGCTVLLKGRTDTISDGSNICLNFTGCAAMSSAGTGDVLAGTVAGLLSRGMTPFDAAKLGAWIVGTAGEAVFAERSYGLCASDLPDAISRVLAEHLDERK